MSVVTWSRRRPRIVITAWKREKFLIRCAAQSALISEPGIPQTLCVYVRKNAS